MNIYCIFNNNTLTVTITIVIVSIIFPIPSMENLSTLFKARAYAIAPRKPENQKAY